MLYLLMTPCGMDTKIEGENNIVRITQMIHIQSPNIAMNGDSSCKVWENYGFELFEYLILSFLAIALMYWRLMKFVCPPSPPPSYIPLIVATSEYVCLPLVISHGFKSTEESHYENFGSMFYAHQK